MHTQSHTDLHTYVTQFVREETNTKNVNQNYIRINFTWMCVSFYCKQISTNIHNKMCINSFSVFAFVLSVCSAFALSLCLSCVFGVAVDVAICDASLLRCHTSDAKSSSRITFQFDVMQSTHNKRRGEEETFDENSSKQNEYACFLLFISVAYVCVCMCFHCNKIDKKMKLCRGINEMINTTKKVMVCVCRRTNFIDLVNKWEKIWPFSFNQILCVVLLSLLSNWIFRFSQNGLPF